MYECIIAVIASLTTLLTTWLKLKYDKSQQKKKVQQEWRKRQANNP